MKPILRNLACASLLVAGSCSTGGGGAEATEIVLGAVTSSAQGCTGGAGNLPGTTCQRLTVSGLGNVPIDVELRVTDPAGAPIGTVVLGSGNLGTSFYADINGGEMLVADLVALGFRVVDRRWVTGWFTTGEDLIQQAGRHATLLTWIHDNLHGGGAFCATGNSAGSGELAYALTHWERGSILDVVVLSGGPPFARVDYLCANPVPAEWSGLCASVVPPGVLTCGTPDCALDAGVVVCPYFPTTAEELEDASLLGASADLDFSDTIVRGLIGSDDCTVAVPQGLLFFDALPIATPVDFVVGAPHTMSATPEGRAAIAAALFDAVTGGPLPSTYALEVRWTRARDERGRASEALTWQVSDPDSGRIAEIGILERTSPAADPER